MLRASRSSNHLAWGSSRGRAAKIKVPKKIIINQLRASIF